MIQTLRDMSPPVTLQRGKRSSPAAEGRRLDELLAHDSLDNVRELHNVLERAHIMADGAVE